MRGGNIRYQAQTLRKVRVPAFADIPAAFLHALRDHATSSDQAAIDAVVDEVYDVVLRTPTTRKSPNRAA